jgi:hypothetical protein
MSISDAKVAANRANAQQSTGPRTEEGKARSSRNAMTHGIFCKDLLVPGEDPAAFAEVREGILRALNPRNALELALVEESISSAWRLRRLRAAEHEAYVEEGAVLGDEFRDFCAVHCNPGEANITPPVPAAGVVMWRMLQSTEGTLEKLSRYEQRLLNTMRRCMSDLRKLQEAPASADPTELVARICQQIAADEPALQNEPTDKPAGAAPGVNPLGEKELYRAVENYWRNADRKEAMEEAYLNCYDPAEAQRQALKAALQPADPPAEAPGTAA